MSSPIRILSQSFVLLLLLPLSLTQAQSVSPEAPQTSKMDTSLISPRMNTEDVSSYKWDRLKSFEDGQAQVVSTRDSVKVMRAETAQWEPLQEGVQLMPGDRLMTGSEGHADLAFDDFYLNLLRMEPATQVVLLKIEPTLIYLEQGRVISLVDHTTEPSFYAVQTPQIQVSAQGTHFWVEYSAQDARFSAGVFPSGKEDGVFHKIELVQRLEGGTHGHRLLLSEGESMTLLSDESFVEAETNRISETYRAHYKRIFENLSLKLPDFEKRRMQGRILSEQFRVLNKKPALSGRLLGSDQMADFSRVGGRVLLSQLNALERSAHPNGVLRPELIAGGEDFSVDQANVSLLLTAENEFLGPLDFGLGMDSRFLSNELQIVRSELLEDSLVNPLSRNARLDDSKDFFEDLREWGNSPRSA